MLLLSLLGGASARADTTGRAAPDAAKPIAYERDVRPLLRERCYACHGNGSRLGGLQIDSRAGLLNGGQSGPAVVPGHSDPSLLIRLVSGGDRARVMPARGKRLSPAEVDLLRRWIDQGVSFGSSAS